MSGLLEFRREVDLVRWPGFPTGLGDQGPRPERKLTHMPCAQLPVAMAAAKTVKVMRPINSVYSMRAAPRRSRHRRRAITRTTYTLLTKPPAQVLACSYMS